MVESQFKGPRRSLCNLLGTVRFTIRTNWVLDYFIFPIFSFLLHFLSRLRSLDNVSGGTASLCAVSLSAATGKIGGVRT